MNDYKQVFPAGKGEFTFRLTLPAIGKFQSEETYPDQVSAAFAVDLLKFYITKKFNLKNFCLRPSLPLSTFISECRKAGISPSVLEDVRFGLAFSVKEMLLNSGHEQLAEYAANEKESRKGWTESSDLVALLVAVSRCLNDGLSLLQKAKRLEGISEEKKVAMDVLESKITDASRCNV